ncbi:hypothetical protein RRG08_008461 [Elysia crispata]|uniref:Uncharacterized protein n=1 Tax=Elysia crispata TaxID=231223 RepID=A0AAE1B256_9GAST|nr:hypothetical protein RRG08_008461 [Elysia crispata]
MDMHSSSQSSATKQDATTNTIDNCAGKFKVAAHVLRSIADMRKDGELCDLVLEVGASQFKVHRLVLCVWSPVVRAMLLQPQIIPCIPSAQEPQLAHHLRIGFSDTGVFEQFVNYLYSGDVPEEAINVPAVLLLAASFKVIQLQQYCEELLKATLNVENMISVYRLAIKFSLKGLEVDCLDFLRKHAADIVQTNEFRKLHAEQINSFLGSECMCEMDPEIKLFLIISWLTEEVANRQQFLVILLSHIDWSVVAADFLLEISQTDNFFTCNPSSLYLLLQTLHSSSISLGPYEDQFEDLKKEYSYLLGSVVSSSVGLGPSMMPSFQPVTISLMSTSGTQADNKNQRHIKLQKTRQEKAVTKPYSHDTSASPLDKKNLTLVNQQNFEEAKYVPELNTQSSHINNVDSVESLKSVGSINTFEGEDFDSSADSPLSLSEVSATKRKNRGQHKNVKDSEPPNKLVRLSHPLTQAAKKNHFKIVKECATKKNSKQNPNVKQASQKQTTLNNNNKIGVKGSKDISETLCPKIEMVTAVETREKNSSANTKTMSVKGKKSPSKNTETDGKQNQSSQTKALSTPLKQPSKIVKTKLAGTKKDKSKNNPPLGMHEGNILLACDLCSFTTKVDLKYYRHLASSHFPGPPHLCEQQDCHFKAPCIKQLAKHRTQHGDKRPFVCTICLQAFRAKNNLYAHIKVHSDERQYKCPECGRSFKQKNTLDQHMVIHSDLRPYLCDLCGFSTKFQNHLILHKKIHSGEVFHCNFPSCLYSTPKRSQLKAHMRSHLGIRTHVCSTCGKAFVEKSHLIRHERIHSADRGYSCPDCSYTSTRLDKLKEHQRKHNSKSGKAGGQTKDNSGNGEKVEASGRKKRVASTGKKIVPDGHSLPGKEDTRKGQKVIPKGDLVEVVVMKGNNNEKSKSRPESNQNFVAHLEQYSFSGQSSQQQSSSKFVKESGSAQQSINLAAQSSYISHHHEIRSLNTSNSHGLLDPSGSSSFLQTNKESMVEMANLSFSNMHNNNNYSQDMNTFLEARHSIHIMETLPQVMMAPPPSQTIGSVNPRDFQDYHSSYINSSSVNVQHFNAERQFIHENLAEHSETKHLQEQFAFLFDQVPQPPQRFPMN